MCGIALYSILATEYILAMKISGQCFFSLCINANSFLSLDTYAYIAKTLTKYN